MIISCIATVLELLNRQHVLTAFQNVMMLHKPIHTANVLHVITTYSYTVNDKRYMRERFADFQ